MGCAASTSTHMMKCSPRCPEIDFFIIIFLFFSAKERAKNAMRDSLQCGAAEIPVPAPDSVAEGQPAWVQN